MENRFIRGGSLNKKIYQNHFYALNPFTNVEDNFNSSFANKNINMFIDMVIYFEIFIFIICH